MHELAFGIVICFAHCLSDFLVRVTASTPGHGPGSSNLLESIFAWNVVLIPVSDAFPWQPLCIVISESYHVRAWPEPDPAGPGLSKSGQALYCVDI